MWVRGWNTCSARILVFLQVWWLQGSPRDGLSFRQADKMPRNRVNRTTWRWARFGATLLLCRIAAGGDETHWHGCAKEGHCCCSSCYALWRWRQVGFGVSCCCCTRRLCSWRLQTHCATCPKGKIGRRSCRSSPEKKLNSWKREVAQSRRGSSTSSPDKRQFVCSCVDPITPHFIGWFIHFLVQPFIGSLICWFTGPLILDSWLVDWMIG